MMSASHRATAGTTFSDPGTVFLVSRAGCGFRLHGVADPLGTPTVATRVVGTAAAFCGAPVSAAQPGGPPIDLATAGFSTQPVYRNGSLWVADTVGVPLAGGGISLIRWLQIDIAAWPDAPADSADTGRRMLRVTSQPTSAMSTTTAIDP